MLRQFLRRILSPPKRQKAPKRSAARKLLDGQSHALLHVAKTGGTSLRLAMRKMKKDRLHLPLIKLPHDIVLSDLNELAPNIRMGFVYRDPLDRFVSAFDARMRNGRPQYQVPWSAREATVFTYFTTANQLAEALSSPDPRLKSAAIFSMNAINHLRRGYEYTFGSMKALEAVKDRLYFICELKDLDNRVGECFAPFGISEADISARFSRQHQATEKKNPLSDLAKENLRMFWAKEFQFYEAFKALDLAARSTA